MITKSVKFISQKEQEQENEKCHIMQYLFAKMDYNALRYLFNYYENSNSMKNLLNFHELCFLAELNHFTVKLNKIRWNFKELSEEISQKINLYCNEVKNFDKNCKFAVYSKFYHYTFKHEKNFYNLQESNNEKFYYSKFFDNDDDVAIKEEGSFYSILNKSLFFIKNYFIESDELFARDLCNYVRKQTINYCKKNEIVNCQVILDSDLFLKTINEYDHEYNSDL